jgi:hypothetical protein
MRCICGGFYPIYRRVRREREREKEREFEELEERGPHGYGRNTDKEKNIRVSAIREDILSCSGCL